MLYGVGPSGYFSRVTIYARGPWFREWNFSEDDGENWWYQFKDDAGLRYLLCNNMSLKDRTEFERLWRGSVRASWIAHAVGFLGAFELITRHSFFNSMPSRRRFFAFTLLFGTFTCIGNTWNAQTYRPLMGAYLRKYNEVSANDLFEITDRRREFFQIDTSSYMSYSHEDLPHGHQNYGPQPDDEVRDASWLVALDKFLNNEANSGLKEHKKFLDYPFEFKDKSFPSAEAARDLIHKH